MRHPSLCGFLLLTLTCASIDATRAQAPNTSYGTSATYGAMAWPQLKRGARGINVETLQRLLNVQGKKLRVDGRFEAATLNAVKAFQKSHRLYADGNVGYQTWVTLVPTLRRGNKGVKVLTLQNLLWAKGHGTTRDGVFGSATERQVKAFQNSKNLKPTGTADALTWCHLLGGSGDGSFD